jgi:ankyrin repeat protein
MNDLSDLLMYNIEYMLLSEHKYKKKNNSSNIDIIDAASKGDIVGVRKYLICSDVNYVNDYGTNALIACLLRSNFVPEDAAYEIAKELLMANIDVYHANNFGLTALHAACDFGNTDIVKLILHYCQIQWYNFALYHDHKKYSRDDYKKYIHSKTLDGKTPTMIFLSSEQAISKNYDILNLLNIHMSPFIGL